ncbi:MAG: hypothetical protein AAGF12_39595 [Myxococcota bacterium]
MDYVEGDLQSALLREAARKGEPTIDNMTMTGASAGNAHMILRRGSEIRRDPKRRGDELSRRSDRCALTVRPS